VDYGPVILFVDYGPVTLIVDYGSPLHYLWIMVHCYNICGLWPTVTLFVIYGQVILFVHNAEL
jgi:hypothetical protein